MPLDIRSLLLKCLKSLDTIPTSFLEYLTQKENTGSKISWWNLCGKISILGQMALRQLMMESSLMWLIITMHLTATSILKKSLIHLMLNLNTASKYLDLIFYISNFSNVSKIMQILTGQSTYFLCGERISALRTLISTFGLWISSPKSSQNILITLYSSILLPLSMQQLSNKNF